MTIVCKIYLDIDEEGEEVLVTECSTKNFPPNSVQNLPDDEERRTIYIYPSTMVGISFEAASALVKKIDEDEQWKLSAFDADFTFETDNYKSGIGLFGYYPKRGKGETLTKKVFRLKDILRLDTSKLWLCLLDKMPHGDNEFLKNLDITRPFSW